MGLQTKTNFNKTHQENKHRKNKKNKRTGEDILMRGAGKFLSTDQRQALTRHFESALLAYNWLASSAAREGANLYPEKPKLHALLHIAMDFGMNPRRVVCMLDEDMVGRAKRIYNACHPTSAPQRSLMRYLIIIGLRWTVALRRLRVLYLRRNRRQD